MFNFKLDKLRSCSNNACCELVMTHFLFRGHARQVRQTTHPWRVESAEAEAQRPAAVPNGPNAPNSEHFGQGRGSNRMMHIHEHDAHPWAWHQLHNSILFPTTHGHWIHDSSMEVTKWLYFQNIILHPKHYIYHICWNVCRLVMTQSRWVSPCMKSIDCAHNSDHTMHPRRQL